jgi:hypothetical protein
VARDVEKLQKVKDGIDALMQKRGGINKSDLEPIQTLLIQAVQHAPSNYAHAAECLNEHIENIVTSAKADVAAFVQRVVMQHPQIENETPIVTQITDERKSKPG